MVIAIPCFCVPILVRIRQIFLEILSGNHLSYAVALNDICDLGNEVKVTWFKLGCGLLWCSCVLYLVRIRKIILQILRGNHLSYAVALNDLCDLENKVKVTQLKLDLRIAFVLLCTKFGKDTSSMS